MLYSIVETDTANDLKVYDYLEYLIDELAKHVEDTGHEFLLDLLPWSQAVQGKCKIEKNLNSSFKVLIYKIACKMVVSFIVWYSCLITYCYWKFMATFLRRRFTQL